MKIENIDTFHTLETKYNLIKKLCDYEIEEIKITYKNDPQSYLTRYIPDEIIRVIREAATKMKSEIEKEIESL